MKTVTILRGVSGSGKSTFAKLIGIHPYICCADDYFMGGGEYRFDPSKLRNAHEWCMEVFLNGIISDEDNIVIANTNTSEWEFEKYQKIALDNGYKVFSVVIENRHGGENIHNVPNDVLTKQKNKLLNSIKL